MKEHLFTEAIKVKDGKFYDLPAHIARMQQTSLYCLGKSVIFSLSEKDIPSEKREGIFKCRIVYSDHIVSVEFIPYTFRTINKLAVISNNDIEYNHKWADRTDFEKLLGDKGVSDDILIIKNGLVTDTSFSNVVFENENGLFTPSSFLLNGTKRQCLIKNGIIKEIKIEEKDIASYSRIRIINTMIDLDDNIWLPSSNLEFI